MKIAMDADCLIKLTKAGLKEKVCECMNVIIPCEVKRETVDQAAGHADALVIAENIEAGLLHVFGNAHGKRKGETAVLELYHSRKCDAIGSDDHQFLGHLKVMGVPFVVPATLVILMLRNGGLDLREARNSLAALKAHISDEEYAMATISLQKEDVR
jgi:hypothetical protein